MPYTRQRPDGMNEINSKSHCANSQKALSQKARSHRKFPHTTAACKTTKSVLKSAALTSSFALFQHAAHAKPKLTGVWGWTSGTQTYLRARPGAQTPPVAKVPTHTKLYVWGTFNGWYRVETTDHIFGWVYCGYLNAPGAEKLNELSHAKARQASDRTAHQTMYGSPEVLNKFYARYGAEGAAKGLAKQGMRVAARPAKERSRTAVSSPRTASTRTGSARTASTPQFRTISTKSGTKAATRNSPTRVAIRDNTPRRAMLPTMPDPSFNDVGRVRLNPAQPTRSSVANRHSQADTKKATSKQNAKVQGARAARTKSFHESQARLAAQNAHAAEEVRAANARKLAQAHAAQIAQAQAAQKFAAQQTASRQAAARQAMLREAALREAATRQAAAKQAAARQEWAHRVAQQRLASQQATWNQRRQARLWAAHQAQARREARAAERAKRLAMKRENLRHKLNGNIAMSPPPTSVPGLRPLSPDELMRARDQYLSQKGNTDDPALSQAPGDAGFTPSSFAPLTNSPFTNVQASFAPTFLDSPALGFTFAAYQPAVPAISKPATFNDEWVSPLPGAPLYVAPAKAATAKNAPAKAAPAKSAVPKAAKVFSVKPVAAKPAPKAPVTIIAKATVAKVSLTKTAKAPSRGGSMRDYARYAQRQQNAFGDGMASQALSYRGMPYIHGAASPNRGFDCSGLIFYLLRQRGYSPPRTAAELASYGQRVERGDLKSGDIVLFANTYKRGVSHVGVYMGNGNFVHAANPRAGVRVDSLTGGYYANKYWGARRVK